MRKKHKKEKKERKEKKKRIRMKKSCNIIGEKKKIYNGPKAAAVTGRNAR